jgi:hypothetical protein
MFTQFNADKGKVFVRKSDNKLFGTVLHLHKSDSIDNYEHRDITSEEFEIIKQKGIKWN